MKKLTTIVIIVLIACSIIGCKAGIKANNKTDGKPDLKLVEERITANINYVLQMTAADIGLSGVKLVNAPEDADCTWMGTATFASGDYSWDSNVAVKHSPDTNTITWWYTDNPGNMFDISLENPVYQMTNEYVEPESYYEPETPVQSVSNSGKKQSTKNEPAVTIGKVEQKGTKFSVFDTNKRELAQLSMPNCDLIGWGSDFFVVQTKDIYGTFKTYNPRGTQIGSISVGSSKNIASVTVDNEGFIITRKGSSPEKYNKNAKRR